MPKKTEFQNFGRNLDLKPRHFYTPENELEVLEIMERHSDKAIRCVGRLHSWNNILDCQHVIMDLRKLREVRTGADDAGNFAEVGAGCQIKQLITELGTSRQWTLPSLGFITEQTIAGAVSTGTHGSGKHSLSHYVRSVRLAVYDPNSGRPVITELNSGDELRAARCSLGSLGIILSVKIEVRGQYKVEEQFRQYKEIEDVLSAEQEFPLQQFYLVPWKWTFFAQQRRETAGKSSRVAWLYHQYRYWVFDVLMHVLLLALTRAPAADACTRMALKRVIPAFVIQNWKVVSDSSTQLVMEHELFRHIELELFVQRSKLADAVAYLTQVLTKLGCNATTGQTGNAKDDAPSGPTTAFDHLQGKYCHHYPICIRRILCDDTLISMACRNDNASNPQEPWYSITLTNLHRGKNREPFLEMMPILTTELSTRFGARTHWGKLFGMSGAQINVLYPQLQKFLTIRQRLDPSEHFLNDWLRECFNNHGNLPEPTRLPPA